VGAPASTAAAERVAALLRDSERAVVLTGAGVSVPSGIPDFRSPGTGLWENVDPMEVAHIDAWRRDPDRFWSFYGARFASLIDKEPNEAHLVIAELERRGLVRAVITQNIDRLHARAGSKELIEVHGSVDRGVCLRCDARVSGDELVARADAAEDGVPRCSACGFQLKSGVVLFGEQLPADAIEAAFEQAARADVMLVIGSSLVVAPVSQLPGVTLDNGGTLAILTESETPWDDRASVRLHGRAGVQKAEVLAALDGAEAT
jgi:NAD-dependent deacetylase